MSQKFAILAGLAGLLMLLAILEFRLDYGLSWLDALYFTVTTMTTVGYGDISLKDAPDRVKVFGILLMLASAALLAATLGVLTDSLIKARLEQLFGPWRSRMRNHTVLCGLGHIGIRILEHLRKLGEQVAVIEQAQETRFLDEARSMGIPVITGDIRLPSLLERVNIREARSIIAATDDDLTNLEIALNARTIRPDIRVVLRMFDHGLADKIRSGFGIKTTFSTSALAAPAFAMAAVDPDVIGSLYLGEDLLLIVQLVIVRGCKLDGITLANLEEVARVSVLSHENASGQRRLHPPASLTIASGDKVIVAATADLTAQIKHLNQLP